MTALAVRMAVATLALGLSASLTQGAGIGTLTLSFITGPDDAAVALRASTESYFTISIERDEAGTKHSTTRYVKLFNADKQAAVWENVALGMFSDADTVEVSFVDPAAAASDDLPVPALGTNTGPTVLSTYDPTASPQTPRYNIPFAGDTPFEFGFSFAGAADEGVVYVGMCANYDAATGTVSGVIAPTNNFFVQQVVLDMSFATTDPGGVELEFAVGSVEDPTVASADGTVSQPVWARDAMTWPANAASASLVAFTLPDPGADGKGLGFVDGQGWVRIDPAAGAAVLDTDCETPDQTRVYLVGVNGATCDDACVTAYKAGSATRKACASGCKHAHPALKTAYTGYINSVVCPALARAEETGCATDAECAAAFLKGCSSAAAGLDSDDRFDLRCAHDSLIARLPSSADGKTTYKNWFELTAGDYAARGEEARMTLQSCYDSAAEGTCVDFVCDRGEWVGLDKDNSGTCGTDAVASCAASCVKEQLEGQTATLYGTTTVFNMSGVGATADVGAVADIPCQTVLGLQAQGQAQFTCTSDAKGIAWVPTGNFFGCKPTASVPGTNDPEPEATSPPFREEDEPTRASAPAPTEEATPGNATAAVVAAAALAAAKQTLATATEDYDECIAAVPVKNTSTRNTSECETSKGTLDAAKAAVETAQSAVNGPVVDATTTASGGGRAAAAGDDDDLTDGELAGLVILIIFIVAIAGVIAWVGYHAYLNRKPKYVYNDLDTEMLEVSPFAGGDTSGSMARQTSQKQLSTSALQVNALTAGGAQKPTEDGASAYPMATATNVYPLATTAEEPVYPIAQAPRTATQRKPRAPGYSNAALAAAGLATLEPEPEPEVLEAEIEVSQVSQVSGTAQVVQATQSGGVLTMASRNSNAGLDALTSMPRSQPLVQKHTMVAGHRGGPGERKSSLAMFAEELGVAAPVSQQKVRQHTVQIRPKKMLQQSVKVKESSSDPSQRPVSMSLNAVVGTSQTDQSVRGWNPRKGLKPTGGGSDLLKAELDMAITETPTSPELESPEFALEKDGESLRLKSTRRANPLFDAAAEADANEQKVGNKTINNV